MSETFDVQMTVAAIDLFKKLAAAVPFEKPGMMVHGQGPTGDVKRAADGSAVWSVERPLDEWKVRIGEMVTFAQADAEVFQVKGIQVWLPMIPKRDEHGVKIDLRDGELIATTLPAP